MFSFSFSALSATSDRQVKLGSQNERRSTCQSRKAASEMWTHTVERCPIPLPSLPGRRRRSRDPTRPTHGAVPCPTAPLRCRTEKDAKKADVGWPPAATSCKTPPVSPSLPGRGGTGERAGTCPSLPRNPWRLWPLQTEPLSEAEGLRVVPLSRGLPPLHLFTTHPVFLSVCFTHHRLH